MKSDGPTISSVIWSFCCLALVFADTTFASGAKFVAQGFKSSSRVTKRGTPFAALAVSTLSRSMTQPNKSVVRIHTFPVPWLLVLAFRFALPAFIPKKCIQNFSWNLVECLIGGHALLAGALM